MLLIRPGGGPGFGRMKDMKKTISLVLVAAILFGFLGMIAFSVFGESYVVRMFIDTPAFHRR